MQRLTEMQRPTEVHIHQPEGTEPAGGLDEGAAWARAARSSWDGVLVRGWRGALVAAVAVAVVTYLASMLQPPRYEASGRVFLSANPLADSSGSTDLQRQVGTQAELATSTLVQRRVADQLRIPAAEVRSRVTAAPSAKADFFVLTAGDKTARG